MKPSDVRGKELHLFVAPYTGAWIETAMLKKKRGFVRVAPYTGAWIETKEQRTSLVPFGVAPYTGAWIETQYWTHTTDQIA